MAGGRIDIEVFPDVSQFPNRLQAGLKSSSGIAAAVGKGLGLAVAAGTTVAAIGLKKVIELGVEYQKSLNTLQSVTQATGTQMVQVGNLAKELGADLSLPATSAADAAAAMTELAKGGLTVEQAMAAAKGTLQLAAAAQIDAARAAEIQSDALNQFGLAATEAGRVADLLANTANAASGEVTDIANALKFVGPVAKTVGAPIESVATAIGLIATQGIRGEQAGTSLRGMIASLAAPSGPAAKALNELGLKAFDATGKFVGLRSITEQLAKAKGRMTEAAFTEAAAIAFGNEGMTVASALASTGAKAFDEMAVSVQRAGGAAEVAGAKAKGLGGAWEGLKSQLETTGIEIFEVIDGPLESVVRSAAKHIADWNDEIVQGIETAVASGQLFGPQLADALSDRAGVVRDAFSDIFAPLARGASGPLNELVNTGIEAFGDLTGVLDNTVDAARPVAEAIGDVGEASAESGGAASAFGAGIGLATDALRLASAVLVPVGNLIGNLVEGFSELPGPVQTAVIALVAYRVAQRALGDTTALSGLRQFTGEMRLQQSLAAANGQGISQMGAAMAAYRQSTVPAVAAARDFADQTSAIRAGAAAAGQPIGVMSAAIGTLVERSPALTSMRTAFNDAAAGATRFGTAAGVAAAAGSGLRTAASGLVGAMGGPFGLAIAGAAVGLSLLASRQSDAAQAAAKHESWVDSLADALRESNGAINESIRASVSKQALDEGALDNARRLGIAFDDITDAALNQSGALEQLRSRLEALIAANTVINEGDLMGGAGTATSLNEQGQAAKNLLDQVNKLAGGFSKAQDDQKKLDSAIRGGTASYADATATGRTLAGAMKTLSSNTADADSRARALKDALDALSGGSISLEASQARVQETLSRINELFGQNVDKTKGWGQELVNAQGGLNLTTENGRRLRDMLSDLTSSTAEVASKTFDMARAQGDDIPTATAKARQAMAEAREAFIGAAQAMGISADQAAILADKAGLIPDNVAMVVSTPGSDKTKVELALVKSLVDQVPPDKPITVRSLSDEAKQKLIDLGFTVRTLPNGTVQVTANTSAAQGALDKFIRDNSGKTIGIRVSVGGIEGVRIGGPNVMSHDGNIVKRYAHGGIERQLTPMRGGLATIVPPNSWRVVGDRLKDDEFYIPDNNAPRSLAIGMEWARRRGYALTRMFAQGGVAAGGGSTSFPAFPTEFALVGGRVEFGMDGLMHILDGRIQAVNESAGNAYARRRGF